MSRPHASARLSLLIGVPLLVLGLVAAVLALRPSGPVALPSPATPVPGRLRPAQEWLALFDQQWGRALPERLSHSRAVWSDEDMRRFVALFQQVIWPRPGPGAEFVDGSGRGNGWFSDGFVKLGRYDPPCSAGWSSTSRRTASSTPTVR